MALAKTVEQRGASAFWHYFWQCLFLIPIVCSIHYCKKEFFNKTFDFRYRGETNLDVPQMSENQCKKLFYETALLRKEISDIREELLEIQSWKIDLVDSIDQQISDSLDTFYSDHVGMFDYASEFAGGSILSTPETTPVQSKFDGFRFFGTINWMFESQPVILLQTALPGKCFAFYGSRGSIRIKLGRPVVITHVSLEHIRIDGSEKSAPKDFQILGFSGDFEEGTHLGKFFYDLDDKIIQTFRVLPKNEKFHSVELHILSNHGNEELTCVYRFRVHSVST